MGHINNSKIVELRVRRNWEQKKLAQEAGVTQSVISRLENGLQPDFKFSVIAKVAKALGVSVDSLLKETVQLDTEGVAVELLEIMAQLSRQPKPIQRQAVGILRGYLATVPIEE